MKKLTSLLPVLFSLFTIHSSLLSCTQDLYEKGDSEFSYMRADFGEAIINGDKLVSRVVTDDDDVLTLTTPYTASWIQRPDTTYRAVIYYNKVENGAEPLSISHVMTLTPHRDSLAVRKWNPDPVGVETAWVGRNHRYLNIGLVLKMGATDKEAAPQSVGILHGGVTINADSTRTADLLFYHQQGDVPEYYSQRAYLSVPLGGVAADSVRLTVVTYDGPFVRTYPLN